MSGSTGKTTTTSTSEPWAEQKPYLLTGFSEAQRLYNEDGPSYFPGNTVSPFSSEQEQALNLGRDRALAGNPTMDAAENYAQGVLSGDYLNNPYDDAVFDNIQSKVMPAVNSNFLASGRYGSGLHSDAMTRALTESYAPYASANYESGLNRMDRAAAYAPTLAANDYADIAALGDVGQQRQMMDQKLLDADIARYAYNEDLPYNKLDQYLSSIQGNYGGTSTSTQPYYKPNPFAQIAGAALTTLPFFLSDRRAKTDIKKVGKLDDGTKVYAYKYKTGGPALLGVMAQEVEKTHPDAVITGEDGLKRVNYGLLAAEV